MTKDSLEQTRQLLMQLGVFPSKERGQSFLVNEAIAERICDVANPGSEDLVLEIGAGLGCLTERLAKRAGRVIAVEIDGRLVRYVQQRLSLFPSVHIVEGDILKLDFQDLLSMRPRSRSQVVANLPYRITSPTIMKILKYRGLFDRAILTVQHEVACRLTSLPGQREYGPLSITVQYWASARISFEISPSAFYPRPKVRSATVEIIFRDSPAVTATDEHLFFRTVRASFAQRRKMLRSNLKAAFPELRSHWSRVEALSPVDLHRRGETLSLEEFSHLARTIGQVKSSV